MGNLEIALPVYADTVGVSLDHWDDTRPVLAIDYSDDICGNPGTFHGGALGGLLEMAAVATLEADLRARQQPGRLTPVNSTVEYLRPAGEQRAFASATIIRAGRRFANIQAWLWQESSKKPVATAIVNILITPVTG